jgi:hypothetical protein
LGRVNNKEAFDQVCREQDAVSVLQMEHATSTLAEGKATAWVKCRVAFVVRTNNETSTVNGERQSDAG